MNEIIYLKNFQLPIPKIRSLTYGMRLFPPLYHLGKASVGVFFLFLPIISLYFQETALSAVEIVVQVFWNLVAVIACTQSIGFLLLFFQQTFFTLTYFKYRYQFLKIKLDQILNLRKICYPKKCLFLKTINMIRLQIQLKALTNLSVGVLQFKRQFRYMPAVAYFSGSVFCEVFLFLSLSRSSNYVIRLISILMLAFFGGIFIGALQFMAELNSASKRLLPELNYALHRMKATQRGKRFSKLFLAEKVAMISADEIAVSIADIFPMTRLAFLQLCFILLQNALLILNLNDS